MEGTVVDSKYQVVRMLGQGGMGAVYEARHLGTGRRVALKVIVPEALLSGGDIVPRFQREARASGAIDSQHVVQVLDTGVDPQTKSPYLVMEHLTGEDVQQLLKRLGPLPVDVVLRIMAQACSGVMRAHAEGIIHRDIKSANLFVAHREAGEVIVKILDFGIAKVRVDPLATSAKQSITRTGSLLGSPLYMPPEQVMGTKDVDPRSDIFSLGVTMYEALCGSTPNHECETLGMLILAICSGKAPTIQERAPWVTKEVADIVQKALATEPGARFQTITEMHAAVTALLPQGASLHEAMLVGVSDAHRSTISPAQRSMPTVTGQTLLLAPRAVAPASSAAVASSFPVIPVGAATGTAFVETNRERPRKGGRWLFLAALLSALTVSAVGIVHYATRTKTTLAPPESSAMSAPSTEPLILPAASSGGVAEAPSAQGMAVNGDGDAGNHSASDSANAAPPTSRRLPQGGVTPPVSPSPRPKVPTPASSKAPGCSPDFYFDDKGVKHFKLECM